MRIEQKWGIINREGKEIIPVKYDEVSVGTARLMEVKLDKKYGIINREGEEIVPIKYESVCAYKHLIVL